jgi:dienelactone hydrolase
MIAAITEPVPGVLVVHEWRGINAYAKKRAEDLAKEGYAAFAVDLYGDGIEIPQSEARAKSGEIGSDFPLIESRFNAALELFSAYEQVDASKIGAIGYCFGGGIALNMARMGTEIAGVVSFHGSLNTGLTASPGDIKTKVLAIQGDQDPVAPYREAGGFSEPKWKPAVRISNTSFTKTWPPTISPTLKAAPTLRQRQKWPGTPCWVFSKRFSKITCA